MSATPVDPNITPLELKERIDRGDDLQIIDVREPREHEINRVPGSTLIPISDVEKRIDEIDREKEIVVH